MDVVLLAHDENMRVRIADLRQLVHGRHRLAEAADIHDEHLRGFRLRQDFRGRFRIAAMSLDVFDIQIVERLANRAFRLRIAHKDLG